MDKLTIYFIGLLLTFICSVVLILFLRKKFYHILIELTGTEQRASFWLTFSNALLILIPLVFAMSVSPKIEDLESIIFEITRQLKWGIIGVVLTLISLAFIMISFIKKKTE